MNRLNDASIMSALLHEAMTGLWSIELDEGAEPRMYADSTMLELLGLEEMPSPEECYRSWYDNIVEEYYPIVRESVEEMISRIRAEVQYPWNHPKLGKIFVRCGGMRDVEYTKGICLRGYHQNITDTVMLKKEKEQLLELNAEILGALNNIFFSIYRVDFQSGMIEPIRLGEEVHDRLESEMSYDDFVREFIQPIFHKEDYEQFRQDMTVKHFQEMLSRGEDRFIGEYRKRDSDGYKWINCSVFIWSPASGKGGAILALQDISKQKQREAKQKDAMRAAYTAAQNANYAKSDFLSRMSHDIRTPLNAITGMTALAKQNIENPEKVKDYIEKIETSGKLLVELINGVLDMSRIESGKFELSENPLRLSEFCEEIHSVIGSSMEEKKQKFSIITRNLVHDDVIGDRGRMQQVFINILSNANKYTPEGGIIDVTLAELPSRITGYGRYQIRFQDNGIGIEESFMDKLFEPFTRAHDSRISQTGGTGLGMAITQNIIQMMNGIIEVVSQPSRGTCFTVILDLKLQQENNRSQENALPVIPIEKLRFDGKRILITEDNEVNREMMKEILEMVGAIVDTAENGKEAVDMFSGSTPGHYAVIIMDIQMPVMDGNEAAETIRKLEREDALHIPIIAMTANAFAEDILLAKSSGMNEHIAKPINTEKMLLELYKWIGSSVEAGRKEVHGQ